MSFRPEVHRMRGLAIVCIVAGHCLTNTDWRGAHEIERGLSLAVRNWTVPFVFIAGYLFRHLDAGADYGAFMRKKARYLLLPYLLVSIPLLLAFAWGHAPEPAWTSERWGGLGAGKYGLYLLTGAHARHFWFIPVMFMIFALAPVWRSLRGTSLHLALVASVTVSIFVDRGMSGPGHPLVQVAHFSSCFVWGMWLATYREALERRRAGWILVFMAVCTGAVLWVSPDDAKMLVPNYVLKMALCPLVLWALDRPLPKLPDRALGQLAELSFGIYFVHVYLLDALRGRYTPGARIRFLGWPGWLWAVVVGTACAVVVVMAVRKVAGKWSREVVGVKPLVRRE